MGAPLLRHLARQPRRPRTSCSPRSATTRRPTTGACSRPARSCACTARIPSGSRSSSSCTTQMASHEEVLHPSEDTERFTDAEALARPGTQASCTAPGRPRARRLRDRPFDGGARAPARPAEDAVPRAARGGARVARLLGRPRAGDLGRASSRSSSRARCATTSTGSSCAARTPRRPTAIAAHDRLRVRRPPQVRVGPPGAGVPVHARRPHRARPHRVDPRAGRDPRHRREGAEALVDAVLERVPAVEEPRRAARRLIPKARPLRGASWPLWGVRRVRRRYWT